MAKEKTAFESDFIFGFTKKRLSQQRKRKTPETAAEAKARQDRMNAKYDQNGNLR